MKKCSLVLFVLFLVALITGGVGIVNAQVWKWGKGASGGLSEGYYCSTDASGSVYVAGFHADTVHFASYSLAGHGAYVVKYDSTGNIKWAISSNDPWNTTAPIGLTTDVFGNEYLIGVHNHTMTFGGYSIGEPGSPTGYLFLAKIDSSGNVKWLENIGDLHTYNEPYIGDPFGSNCITTDERGNVYMTYPYAGTASIDGYTLDSANYGDVFVGKFDSFGNAIWVKGFKAGPMGSTQPGGIAVTPSHKIYISGFFDSDSLFFGTDILVDTGTHANGTGYLAKLDSNGNPIWARGTGGSSGGDEFTGVATNADEDVYLTGGYFSCVLHLSPADSLPMPWYTDYGFLAKFDSAGSVTWVKLMQGKYVFPWMPAIDSCGNVWVSATLGTGVCTDTIDGHILSSDTVTGDPMFIAGWSSSGSYLAGATLPSGGDDLNSIAIDKSGNIFVEGDYETYTMIVGSDTLYGPGPFGTLEFNFVAKYKPNVACGSPISLITGDSVLCKGDTLALNEPTGGGIWSSSNVGVAIVGSGTGLVVGGGLGVAVITYSIGGGYVTTTVTVMPAPSAIVGPADLCLGSIDLSDATPGGVWSTSNSSVATVGSVTGIVTGIATGEVTITYAISADCYVTATDSVLACVAGVQSVPTNDNKIELFPNPASNLLTVTSAGQIASVVISNPLGQVVYSSLPIAIGIAGGGRQTSIDVSALPSGVYFVRVNNEVRKFVKE